MRNRILIVIAIAFCFVVAFAFSPAQGRKKFDFVVAYVQSGAPVQLTSITHGIDFLYQKAEVTNVSDRTVSSVTFGVLLHETDPNQSETFIAMSQQVPTDIKPGQVRSVDVLGLRAKEAQEKASQFKSNPVVAEFGVLGVRFEDGGSWTFDLEKNRTLSSSPIATSSGGGNCKPITPSGATAFLGKAMPFPLRRYLPLDVRATTPPRTNPVKTMFSTAQAMSVCTRTILALIRSLSMFRRPDWRIAIALTVAQRFR